jgi:hypothetical protein
VDILLANPVRIVRPIRVGAMIADLKGEEFDQIAALIGSSRALSSVLALMLAGTPHMEISASELDALTDLSYKIHLNLSQLEEIWVHVANEQTKEHD